MVKQDLIVIGGGHAGIEAAYIAAKRGLSVKLITLKARELGEMSCNPAIGGLAKGHLVKEVDALGGLMAKAIDETAIQYRLLNTRKGVAVRSSRAQADKYKYNEWMCSFIKTQKNIELFEGNASELIINGIDVLGVRCEDGSEHFSKKTILATGTFLDGLMHIGFEKFIGGRWGSNIKVVLANSLKQLGIKVGRLKTGTPARLDKTSINFGILEPQFGDKNICPFSFDNEKLNYQQQPCYITYTNKKTHDVITKNLNRSPLYSGVIRGTGPRYCPSIEDKIVRFADKDRHQIFLEPESLRTNEIYPNGVSTSLPKDVQDELLRTIPGLENVKILKYGYAVEYDFVPPNQIDSSLKVKNINNLYLAGQINGTSGYEEAAAQGLIAGINASNEILNFEPIKIYRHEAYIGVLIDDLISKGTEEPYRMFTSRAEHRLLLREDNADIRLKPKAIKLGLLDSFSIKKFERKNEAIDTMKKLFETAKVYPTKKTLMFLEENKIQAISRPMAMPDFLKKEDILFSQVDNIMDYLELKDVWEGFKQKFSEMDLERIWEFVYTDYKLEGYIKRDGEKIAKLVKMEETKIPVSIDYSLVLGITREVRDKLTVNKPKTMYEALRISGVTPAAIDALYIHIRKFHNGK